MVRLILNGMLKNIEFIRGEDLSKRIRICSFRECGIYLVYLEVFKYNHGI